jgi:hypothetical protein
LCQLFSFTFSSFQFALALHHHLHCSSFSFCFLQFCLVAPLSLANFAPSQNFAWPVP